jgi:ectoine hydroxylase-related dioxygenase (phytanoyl-CoA dioxygenase family)
MTNAQQEDRIDAAINAEGTMTEVVKVKSSTGLPVINEILERDGCIVIEDVLDARQVAEAAAELAPHFDDVPNCAGDFYGYVTKRLSGLIAKSRACQSMAINPAILGVMDHFLLKGCRGYHLNLTQAIQIGPGEPAQVIHRDDLMFNFVHPEFEAMINTMWAVDDFTAENGATHVVPGSHKWPLDRQAQPHEETQGVMKRGSVLIYLGSLLHGGGANRTDRPRTGIVHSYCLGWLRQAEPQFLAVPAEIARECPERLQRLLGYFVHEPNLGSLEGQDPIGMLTGTLAVNGHFNEFLPDEVRPLLAEHRARLKAA